MDCIAGYRGAGTRLDATIARAESSQGQDAGGDAGKGRVAVAGTKTTWHGDETNGIEIREQDDFVDEVLLYVDGECVFHMEAMSDQCYWYALYAKNHEAHCNVFSKNGKAHVSLNAEGWPKAQAWRQAIGIAAPKASGAKAAEQARDEGGEKMGEVR
jgi:hypothetical protein